MAPEITKLIENLNAQIIASIILLLFSLSLAMFFWGVADFIRGSNNEEMRKTGKDHMIWGIIIIFVMISVWGFVAILEDAFFGL